jgi:anaerobic magnesium-protoporphyrin IX monomethyl ester cyclase
MARVALVNPQLVSSGWGRGLQPRTMDDALPRRSLTALSPSLTAAGHDVELVDLRLLADWQAYDDSIAAIRPDVVCVTAHTAECEDALECLRRARRLADGALTVAGGIHFTMYPEAAIGSGVVDRVIRGEGETSLPALIETPDAFPSVSWGATGDLDRLPFEDRDLYPDYAARTMFPMWDLPRPIVDMMTKRGCPWQCRFCCGPGEQNLYTRPSPGGTRRFPTFRHRSVADVVAEMKVLEERWGFRGVVFHDDQFIIRRDWVTEFCRAMHDAGFVRRGVRWWAAVRADVICREPDLIARMADAGQQVMSIGFESFSDRMLRWMRKDTTRDENLRAAEICHRLGLDLFANVIFGMPFSDGRWYLEDDLETLAGIEQIRPRHFSPSFFSPIPGSWFHQWAVDEGLLIGDAQNGTRTPSEAKIEGVDYATLSALVSDCRRRIELARRAEQPWLRRLRTSLAPMRTGLSAIRSKLA